MRFIDGLRREITAPLLAGLLGAVAGFAPVHASPVAEPSSEAQVDTELTAEANVPLDEKALWLPVKYQGYYIKLVAAAQAALDQPRCLEVKQATLDLRQTTSDRALFRILCRQASGNTYTEMIEGNNYTSLTPKKSSVMDCRKLLIDKTQQMVGVTWLNKKGESLTSKKAGVERYQWDFDAVSIDGAPLHYRAICESQSGQPRMQITPRR